MHNWRFLIPVLTVIGSVASISEHTAFDVRQHRFERLDRISPISRSPSVHTERTTFTSFSNYFSDIRENNRRCQFNQAREQLNHRRIDLAQNRDNRFALKVRNLDILNTRDVRKTLRNSITERSNRQNRRNIVRDVDNKYSTTTRKFDFHRIHYDHRPADNQILKDDNVRSTREALSLERVNLLSNRNSGTNQKRSRSTLDAERTSRIIRSINDKDSKLSTRVLISRLTPARRLELMEKESRRYILRETTPRNTYIMQRRQTRDADRMIPARLEILSRINEHKLKPLMDQDSTLYHQKHQQLQSSGENLVRSTRNSYDITSFKRDNKERSRSAPGLLKLRLNEQTFPAQRDRQSERFNNNIILNTYDEHSKSQVRTVREMNLQKWGSIDVYERKINTQDEGFPIRQQSEVFDAVRDTVRQSIRATRSVKERTSRIFESGVQRKIISNYLNERFIENIKDVRDPAPSRHELSKGRMSHSYRNEERQSITRSPTSDRNSKFSRNMAEIRRKESRRFSLNTSRDTRINREAVNSRVEKDSNVRSRETNLLSNEDNLNNRFTGKSQPIQSAEVTRVRINKRQARMSTSKTQSSNNINYINNDSRRQSIREITLERYNTDSPTVLNERATVQLSPTKADSSYRKDTSKSEKHASNRMFAVELIATRQDIFEKHLNNIEFKTMVFYGLQSIYVCAILFNFIGRSSLKGNTHKMFNWPTAQHRIKVD